MKAILAGLFFATAAGAEIVLLFQGADPLYEETQQNCIRTINAAQWSNAYFQSTYVSLGHPIPAAYPALVDTTTGEVILNPQSITNGIAQLADRPTAAAIREMRTNVLAIVKGAGVTNRANYKAIVHAMRGGALNVQNIDRRVRMAEERLASLELALRLADADRARITQQIAP